MGNGTRSRRSKSAAFPVRAKLPAFSQASLAIITVIALFSALYVARTVILPIVLALIFSFLLSPVVRFLTRLHIPTLLAAGMVIAALFFFTAAGVLMLSEPAAQWAERAPEALNRLQVRLEGVLEAMRRVREATERVQELASRGGEAAAVEIRAGPGLQGMILSLTWQFLAGTILMIFLLYFLLGMGGRLFRRFICVLPRMSHRKVAVVVARHIERDVSRYLFTVAAINTVLGLAVGSVMYLMGMPNPVLWGVMAGLLNFIPYLGPLVTLAVLAAAAILSFDTLGQALMRPAAFFALTTLEGQLVTPLILGRRLTLNPIVIFVSLIFWGWMWGIIGALVAVPLTMIVRILCDAIPPLKPVGELLSR